MTIEEIRAEMSKLTVAMIEKGIVGAAAECILRNDVQDTVLLRGKQDSGFPGSYGMEFFRGDTPAECFAKAWALVDAIRMPHDVAMEAYMLKLANAIDYGTEKGIPAEYVDPVRITQKAMSDNLIEVTK